MYKAERLSLVSNPARKPKSAVLKSLQDKLDPHFEFHCKEINLKEHTCNFLFFQYGLFYISR